MKVLTAWENLTVICLPPSPSCCTLRRIYCHICYLSFQERIVRCTLSKAFRKSRWTMLWAPILPNLYFTPSQCLTILFKWNLSIFLRFTFASLTLRSDNWTHFCFWYWASSSMRHVWITVHCVIISAALVRRSSWKLLLSGSEVGGGELRMRKRDQGAPAMLKFHNRTMRMRTLISTTRSSTLASSRLPGRKLTALTVYSFLLKTLFVVILNRPLQTSPKGLVSIRWCCLY